MLQAFSLYQYTTKKMSSTTPLNPVLFIQSLKFMGMLFYRIFFTLFFLCSTLSPIPESPTIKGILDTIKSALSIYNMCCTYVLHPITE